MTIHGKLVEPRRDEESVSTLGKRAAVGDPEQRRPVEDDIVVVEAVDDVKQGVEWASEEQGGGSSVREPLGMHASFPVRNPRRRASHRQLFSHSVHHH